MARAAPVFSPMPNIFDDNMPALHESLLQFFSNDAVYDPLIGATVKLLVVPTQPASGEGATSKFLRIEFRQADLGAIEPQRGHRITVKGATYQVLDFERDIYGWTNTICEAVE